MIKGLNGTHATPEKSTLKQVGRMVDVAIPGHCNLNSDLDVSTTYQRYYNMLSEEDRNKIIAQQQEYLAKMRAIFNGVSTYPSN